MDYWIRRTMTRIVLSRCLRAAVAAITLGAIAGCIPPPADPAMWQRCNRDYLLWVQYDYNQAVIHTGQKMRADYALYQCQMGDYRPGIEVLEDILRRTKVPIPK